MSTSRFDEDNSAPTVHASRHTEPLSSEDVGSQDSECSVVVESSNSADGECLTPQCEKDAARLRRIATEIGLIISLFLGMAGMLFTGIKYKGTTNNTIAN